MLSLALVFLVLVFVYPLKMLFASFFGWISNGWLMTQPFSFKDFSELRSMFAVYGAAWTVLSLLVSAQLLHAWRLRTVLALSPLEQLGTRFELYGALVNAAFGLIAVALALSLPERMPHGWMYSLPGSIYFGLGPARWGLRAVELRARQRLPADL